MLCGVPIFARCSIFAPYFSKYSCAPFANIRGAPGPKFSPAVICSSVAVDASPKIAPGGGLSGQLLPKLPGFIRSKPSASAHSINPLLTSEFAW